MSRVSNPNTLDYFLDGASEEEDGMSCALEVWEEARIESLDPIEREREILDERLFER